MEEDFQAPPVTEELLAIDGCWERESIFLEGVGPWEVSNGPGDGSTSMNIWALITGLTMG